MFNSGGSAKPPGKSGRVNGKWTVIGDINSLLASSTPSDYRSNNSSNWERNELMERSGIHSIQNNAAGGAVVGDLSHFREAGIIEKLLPSYGFIQCCERQARLFFHYSQFSGNIDHLRLGDAVEFEMTYDKRTGKPIASYVFKIPSEALGEEVSTERVNGFITIELAQDKEGRVAYENRGECFFLPFGHLDLEDSNVKLRSKDRVSFCIAKDKNGTLRARKIALETPSPERLQGCVCAIKDSFGFIERFDQVAEVFFHSSECSEFKQLNPGDYVEFMLQVRNGKETAISVERVSSDQVQSYEHKMPTVYRGQVLQPLDRNVYLQHLKAGLASYALRRRQNFDPFPGSIIYRTDNEIEIPLPYREIRHSLFVGDWVTFRPAEDKREALTYATDVKFLPESFKYSGETREKGIVCGLTEEKGYIMSDQGVQYSFFQDEQINDGLLQLNMAVEFTVTKSSTEKDMKEAKRILLRNTLLFDKVMELPMDSEMDGTRTFGSRKGYVVETNTKFNCGLISLFDNTSTPKKVYYLFKDSVDLVEQPEPGARVDLKLVEDLMVPGKWRGVQVQLVQSKSVKNPYFFNIPKQVLLESTLGLHCGYICMISKSFGIIQSNSLLGRDIAFRLDQLPEECVKIGSLFEFVIEYSAKGLWAYDIHVSLSQQVADEEEADEYQDLSNERILGDWEKGEIVKIGEKTGYIKNENNKLVLFDIDELDDQPFMVGELVYFVMNVDFKLLNFVRAQKITRVYGYNKLFGTCSHRHDDYSYILLKDGIKNIIPTKQNIQVGTRVKFQMIFHMRQRMAVNVQIHSLSDTHNGKSNDSLKSPEDVKEASSLFLTGFSYNNTAAEESFGKMSLKHFSKALNLESKQRSRGFVAAIKDSYGFIESEDHQNEIFFHFSVVENSGSALTLLQEVEYVATMKNEKMSAETVRPLPSGTIEGREVFPELLNGIVLRSVRCLSPDQKEYCGLIETKEPKGSDSPCEEDGPKYQFSMISLHDMHDFVHKDDIVTFQVALLRNGQRVAVNVKPVRQSFQAYVDTIKGNFGFLDYEVEDGKKLFFHMSEVKNKSTVLQAGDKVEFVIVHNKRTTKHSACSVVKISEPYQRPDRLIMKCKSLGNNDSNDKSALLRQPKGPDGGKGFNSSR